MAEFSGVSNFFSTLTGRDAIQAAAADAATKRLIAQRSQQALMDKRLAQAAQAKIESDAFASLLSTMPAGRDRDILLANRGGSFSGLQRGLGYEQQNTARGAAMEALVNGLQGGQGVPVDMLNALIGIAGNKTLTPSNVSVQRQASAKAAADEARAALSTGQLEQKLPAEISALEALTGQREASAGLSTAKTENPERFRASAAATGDELPGATTLALLFQPDPETGESKLTEFMRWQAQQVKIDPAYNDFMTAYQKWLIGEPAQAKPPPRTGPSKEEAVSVAFQAPEAPPPAQRPAAPPPEQGPDYGNQADADLLLTKAQEAIAAGANRAEVVARLKAELERRGFTYAAQ